MSMVLNSLETRSHWTLQVELHPLGEVRLLREDACPEAVVYRGWQQPLYPPLQSQPLHHLWLQ